MFRNPKTTFAMYSSASTTSIIMAMKKVFLLTAVMLAERSHSFNQDEGSISILCGRGEKKALRLSSSYPYLDSSGSDGGVEVRTLPCRIYHRTSWQTNNLPLSSSSEFRCNRNLCHMLGLLPHHKSSTNGRVLTEENSETVYQVDYHVAKTHPPKNNR
ncbi:hypothetical protein KP509_13G011500 [Ceratopteris richardii]|uniref:Uncharacterized protein n=1 Tax=Ceratopteris richardii TaxID=49495 RepID=A0A8T2TFF4_CERRI|nr:hypothetical protein KP509_13G011500 [Ceratopteris richardii]